MRMPVIFVVPLAATLVAGVAVAQESPQPQGPLPPLPSSAPTYAPEATPPATPQPPPPISPEPPPAYASRAPRVVYGPPEPQVHAPKYALWVGGRLGWMGYGGAFYGTLVRDPNGFIYSITEPTGNWVSSGPSVQLDVGARLSRRYVPFIFYERDFLSAGRRFDGDDASVRSELYGGGFRFTSGDVNTAGFLTELSIGRRNLAVQNRGATYTMSSMEFFKLGLGAEIRLATEFTISPLFTVATGVMSDTHGDVPFSVAGSRDGLTHPPYTYGHPIEEQRGYYTLGIGIGGHFDLFGK